MRPTRLAAVAVAAIAVAGCGSTTATTVAAPSPAATTTTTTVPGYQAACDSISTVNRDYQLVLRYADFPAGKLTADVQRMGAAIYNYGAPLTGLLANLQQTIQADGSNGTTQEQAALARMTATCEALGWQAK